MTTQQAAARLPRPLPAPYLKLSDIDYTCDSRVQAWVPSRMELRDVRLITEGLAYVLDYYSDAATAIEAVLR